MNPSTLRPERTRSSISRRTVVVGTAWAVPAVVVASAAPALAASGVTVTIGGICIGPGGTLRIQLVITNPTGLSGTLTVNSLTIASVAVATGALPTVPVTTSASATAVITVTNPGIAAGASVAISLGYSVALTGGPTTTGTASATLVVSTNGQCAF